MPRQRSRKGPEGRMTAQQLKTPRQDERDEDESDNESLNPIDEEEEELARVVLGDEPGFMAELVREAILDEDKNSEDEKELNQREKEEDYSLEGVDDADLFFLDSGSSIVRENALVPHTSPGDELSEAGDQPVWEDSDDDRLMVSLAGNPRLRKLRVNEGEDLISGREYIKRLRRQFLRLNPTPEWAISSERPAKRRRRSSASSSASDNGMDVDNEDISTLPLAKLLKSAGSLNRTLESGKQTKLRPEVLDIQRTRDIPTILPSTVASLTFHPQYPVLLSSGLSSTLYLHHIAPTAIPIPNPLLTSVHIRSTPIHTSTFLPPNGDKIFFSGRRRFFHTWDLESGTVQKVTRVYGQKEEQKSMERFKLSPCGRYMGLVGSSKKGGGVINILDANTTQWIAAARVEGRGGVSDFSWWSNGEGLTIISRAGEVGEWCVQSRSFLAIWNDEGSFGSTVLALGGRIGNADLGGDRWVAIGSSSGVVNIYDRKPWVERGVNVPKRPEPTKRFMQLVTSISCLEFSPDGQLLVFASLWKRDALRIVHLPSCTVFKNWPTSQTPFGRISAVAFSGGSNMLAIGNEQGKIRLWEIRV